MTPILQHIKQFRKDAVLYQVQQWMDAAADGPYERTIAIHKIGMLLSKFKDHLVQSAYADEIARQHKIKAAVLRELMGEVDATSKEVEESETFSGAPAWMDTDEILDKGFCTVHTDSIIGYYGWGQTGKVQLSNYLIRPLFHVYAKEESRLIVEIQNKRKKAVLDIPSKVLVSKDLLQQYTVGEGGFIFFGSNAQLLRISEELLNQFRQCLEIRQLGWQPEGFFCYVNKVYHPKAGIIELDEWGIAELGSNHFLIPASCKAYADLRSADDPFENDRAIPYLQAGINLEEWCRLMNKVYGLKGAIAIAYVFMTVFRDVVFSIDHTFPHLYGFGERSSGKSKWAESITAFFYSGRSAFNLNSGTDYAFFNYMQRFRNCPAHLNEFDDKVVREEWFQAIKGVFDGEGRERGKGGSRNRTEVQRVHGSLLLTGQYLSTKDDNSMVSRSIIAPFAEKEYTDQEKAEYDALKRHEGAGLSSLVTEILKYRDEVKQVYYTRFNELLGSWRRAAVNDVSNQRIMQSYCHLSTMWTLFSKWFKLPMSVVQFNDAMFAEALKYSEFIRETDTLTEFWKTVEFLLDQNLIEAGWDFKIITTTELKLRNGKKVEHVHKFTEPTKVLLLRINNVHKLYQQSYRSRTNKEGMTLDNLIHYFSSRQYYVGNVKQAQFKRWIWKTETVKTQNLLISQNEPQRTQVADATITSAFAFVYDSLGCNLERFNADTEQDNTEAI